MKRRTKHLSVRDGNLIPLGNNFAYVLGDHPNKVDDVDIGPNNRNGLSVNHGEIMQFGGNGVRVFSAEPILGGLSPSKLIQLGMNPNAVFAAQERYKDIHNLKDDGSHAQLGKETRRLNAADSTTAVNSALSKLAAYKALRQQKENTNQTEQVAINTNQEIIDTTQTEQPIIDNSSKEEITKSEPKVIDYGYIKTNRPKIASDTSFNNNLFIKTNNFIQDITTEKPYSLNTSKINSKRTAKKENKNLNINIYDNTDKNGNIVGIPGLTSEIINYLSKKNLIHYGPSHIATKILNSETGQDIIGVLKSIKTDSFNSAYNTAKNGISRKLDKLLGNNEQEATMISPDFSIGDSEYGIIPLSFTGDTLRYRKGVLPREYFIPESINITQYRFGVRNKGDLTELNTEGAIIPTFFEFTNYNKDKINPNYTYIGIDSKGNFKAGLGSEFNDGDKLTRTFSNKIYSFSKDAKGNYKFQTDSKGRNKSYNFPVVIAEDEKTNTKKEVAGPVNIMVNKSDKDGSQYGSVTGGRVLVRVGNETRLLSGSIQQIEKEFEAMKQRHNSDHGIFYMTDNGSYNKALRTYDKHLKKEDLANYDEKNRTGGNFIYIAGNKEPKFPSDTVLTPFIRTINDESYKKGHSLINERQGVVLHHTGYIGDKDLKGVTNQFLYNKSKEASAHVIIGEDGRRRIFATPDKVTFHGGASMFNGRTNVNDFMIGIEFQGDTNRQPLTNAQVESVIEYLEPIIRENNISLENITTHETVRKLYNEYVEQYNKGKLTGRLKIAPNKPDITQAEYEKIIKALIGSIYYKKDNTNNKKLGGEIEVKNDYLTIPLKGNPLYDITGETKYSDYTDEPVIDFSGIETTNKRPYNAVNAKTAYDYFKAQGANDYQIAALLANAIEESGIEPYALDKTDTYYGISQWDKGRYSVARKSKKDKDYSAEVELQDLNNQLAYYYNSVMNGNTRVDWNHGGKGSGYNTAADARQAFKDAASVDDAVKALVLGYVRPTGGIDSYKNRAKVAEQIYKLISKQ